MKTSPAAWLSGTVGPGGVIRPRGSSLSLHEREAHVCRWDEENCWCPSVSPARAVIPLNHLIPLSRHFSPDWDVRARPGELGGVWQPWFVLVSGSLHFSSVLLLPKVVQRVPASGLGGPSSDVAISPSGSVVSHEALLSDPVSAGCTKTPAKRRLPTSLQAKINKGKIKQSSRAGSLIPYAGRGLSLPPGVPTHRL